MEIKEIVTGIIIPLIAGFLGGGVHNIIVNRINKNKKQSIKKTMKTKYLNVKNGDVFNGNKTTNK